MAKVLIVDDEPDLRTLMGHIATDAGHCVKTASNGREALSAVERDTPDVIVLDVHMPVMGGVELLEALWVRALHTGTPLIPVIVLTADGDPNLVRVTTDLGAKAYFVKSLMETQQLEESIARLTVHQAA